MIAGARQGILSGLRRLTASAMARDLRVFLIPGADITRAYGLDIEAAGLRPVASPRHANVLLVVGPLSQPLRDAAAIIYAQMLRPRALFVIGTTDLSPLPTADITADLSQQELVKGVRQLRAAFTEGAFYPEVTNFDAPMLHIHIEYTCPMHPEVIQDQPGSCPKCGMTLIPHEVQAGMEQTQIDPATINNDTATHKPDGDTDMNKNTATEYTCPMHPEVVQNEPGSCPKCGMFLQPREKPADASSETSVKYTCPMHPEVIQDEPGSCPKCGMFLEPVK